jgi:NitT/TauT family transport system permease protein
MSADAAPAAIGPPSAAARRHHGVVVQRVILLGGIVVAWEAVTGGFGMRSLVESAVVARPSLIAVDVLEYARSGLLARDLETTLSEAFLGLVLGVVGGVVVGLLLGYFRRVADVVEPLMVSLNSLPRITVAPMLVLWFGLGMTSKVLLSLFTVFFVIFFNTFLGVRSVDPELVKVVRTMGGDGRHVARMVVIPSVCSWIFAALRTSVSFALTGAVVGEFVGSTRGLGYRMLLAAGVMNTERVFAIMILLMIVGVSLVEVSRRVERHLLRWRPALTELG